MELIVYAMAYGSAGFGVLLLWDNRFDRLRCALEYRYWRQGREYPFHKFPWDKPSGRLRIVLAWPLALFVFMRSRRVWRQMLTEQRRSGL